jgi:hypothetical protein
MPHITFSIIQTMLETMEVGLQYGIQCLIRTKSTMIMLAQKDITLTSILIPRKLKQI